MENSKLYFNKDIILDYLHDGHSAYVFDGVSFEVYLLGPLSISILRILNNGKMTLNEIIETVKEKVQFDNDLEEVKFLNSMVCNIGQLFNLSILRIEGGNNA